MVDALSGNLLTVAFVPDISTVVVLFLSQLQIPIHRPSKSPGAAEVASSELREHEITKLSSNNKDFQQVAFMVIRSAPLK
jgi:hypothetical protein